MCFILYFLIIMLDYRNSTIFFYFVPFSSFWFLFALLLYKGIKIENDSQYYNLNIEFQSVKS